MLVCPPNCDLLNESGTPNPQLQTRNPKPETRNPKPETPNSKLETLPPYDYPYTDSPSQPGLVRENG